MTLILNELEDQGYLIIDGLINDEELRTLVEHCKSEFTGKVGTRNLLRNEWVKFLADKICNHQDLERLLPKDSKAIQCNYFNKSTTDNWSVTSHRDLSIPVASEIDSDKWSGWSKKEGVLYAQPPRSVLESLLIIRIHLEDNNKENGALRLMPGSHIPESKESAEVICEVKKGGALIMRPLILHSSPKLLSGARRVLHFVFGPHTLPDGAQWPKDGV